MGERSYRIIATKNGWQKEFYFFKQVDKGDIYYSQITSYSKSKASVHASGAMHIRDGNEITKLGTMKPLNEFDGVRQLFNTEIGNLVFESKNFGKKVTKKKLTDHLIIDLTKFENSIGLEAYLIEPGQEGKLQKIAARNENIYYKIFKETNPWIAVMVYNSYPGKF